MPPKRPVGLGRASRAKKIKSALPDTADELTIELAAAADATDAVAQLESLWETYLENEDRKELMANGVVHECDRILRKQSRREATGAKSSADQQANKNSSNNADSADNAAKNAAGQDLPLTSDDESIVLNGNFYAIYALALSALAFYHTEQPKEVDAFFSEAQDRIALGHSKFKNSPDLLFAEARVMVNRIPLAVISRLDLKSTVGAEHAPVSQLLDESLTTWEKGEQAAEDLGNVRVYSPGNAEYLLALDDLLDMIDNFGETHDEDEDSDDENDAVAAEKPPLAPSHPLTSVRLLERYRTWWREHTAAFLEKLASQIRDLEAKSATASSARLPRLRRFERDLAKRIGLSYLYEAEEPAQVFTHLAYYASASEKNDGLTKEEAQKTAIALYEKALTYLVRAQDDEEPQSWVDVAEAMILLGNIQELDGREQETNYKKAEEILVRANNATNGKFEEILNNLLE